MKSTPKSHVYTLHKHYAQRIAFKTIAKSSKISCGVHTTNTNSPFNLIINIQRIIKINHLIIIRA